VFPERTQRNTKDAKGKSNTSEASGGRRSDKNLHVKKNADRK
jgi:hypothetical protein